MDFPQILIQAVPWDLYRAMNAAHLERLTGGKIIWDQEHEAFITWLSILTEAGTEPVVVLEDDAELSSSWSEDMSSLIERYPDRFISFHTRNVYTGDTDCQIVDAGRLNGTPGYYLPAGYASEILSFAQPWYKILTNDQPGKIVDFDTCMVHWLRSRGEQFVVSTPSLVDHRPGVSAIDPKRPMSRPALDFKA